MFLETYFEYIKILRKKRFLNKKKRFSFFYLKKKKFYFRYIIHKSKKRRRILRRKQLCKKKIYSKYLKFIFVIKSKKWLDYYLFFKLIVLSSYYFSDDYLYLKLKLSLYTFLSFSSLYKSWFIKKLKRKFSFKRKFARNKYGELMLIIRPVLNKKKKKN